MPEKNAILQALAGDDKEAVRQAAFDAGDLGLTEAIDHLVRHIQSSNLGVQEAADEALRRIGGPACVQAVIPLLRSDDAPVRNVSMDILRAVGHEDFDTLSSLLHDDDPDIRIFATDILGSCPGIEAVKPLCEALLRDPEVNVRYQAAVSLGDLGKKSAAQCLNKAMNDEEWVQFAVIEALAKIRDESSVDALAKALDSSSDLVGSMIVEALGKMGNIKAVALLLKRMDDAPTPLRNLIVKAVVSLIGGKSLTLLSGAERENFREYLRAALLDDDLSVQDAAIRGLAYVGGDKATHVILNLAAELNPDEDVDHDRLDLVRQSLAAIGMNGELAKALRMELVHLDEEDDSPTRGYAYKTAMIAYDVCALLKDPAPAAQVLMDVFWDMERDVQRKLIHILSDIAPISARPFFLRVVEEHEDGTVIKGALRFLGNLADSEDGQVLFGLLAHPFDDVKEAALEGCIAIGGQEMNDRFRAMLQDPDPVRRMMAVYAIGKLCPADYMEDMRQALEDEIPDIRKIALEALAHVCNEETVDIVLPRLHDENREVRITVVELLGQHCGTEAVPHLIQALADDDEWVRIRAVEALGRGGRAEAVPELVPLLESSNKLVVLKVVEALGAIGGQAAFRSLLDVVGRDDPEIQDAAEDALSRLQSEHGGEF